MTINEYQTLAMRTMNRELSERDILLNGVMGLCGESGEVIDLVKKHISHGHELDKTELLKELGDVAWYLTETATVLGFDLEQVFAKNIEKLQKRYPDGFKSEDSINRVEYQTTTKKDN